MKTKRGFTLIELITVVAIITILAGTITIVVTGQLARARATQVVKNIKTISEAVVQAGALACVQIRVNTPGNQIITSNTSPFNCEEHNIVLLPRMPRTPGNYVFHAYNASTVDAACGGPPTRTTGAAPNTETRYANNFAGNTAPPVPDGRTNDPIARDVAPDRGCVAATGFGDGGIFVCDRGSCYCNIDGKCRR